MAARQWSPEQRARQSVKIQQWRPWARSTGPKTEEGKVASAGNANKHGLRGRKWLELARDVNDYLRDQRERLKRIG